MVRSQQKLMSTQGSPQLGLPESWVNELFEREHPRFTDRFVFTDLEALHLSFFPHLLQEKNVDPQAVCEDLSAGFQPGRWDGGKGGFVYNLTGERFRVQVRAKVGKNTGTPLAVITGIETDPPKRLRDWEIVTRVQMHPVWDEALCDIEGIWKCSFEEQRAWQRQRQLLWEEKRALIGRPAKVRELADEERLHSLARRNYGALRTMLSLLETRAEVEQAASATGAIYAQVSNDNEAESKTPARYIAARISVRNGIIEEGDHIEVTVKGRRGFRSKIEEIDGNVFYLPEPEGVALADGTPVTLTVQSRFSMKSHARALDRFLRMEVEGEWPDLATLLCEPGRLQLGVDPAPPEKFFAEADGRTLNDEQKKAVAGALATPHTFFIQGPPGTGKTTVIAEIIQHLVERGERVLMLAPTHVAVDEVLRRVGNKPGVLPVRLAWSESKVDASVRQFTPSSVTQELVKKIRQPNASRSKVWEQTVQQLQAELSRITRWRKACTDFENMVEKCRTEQQELDHFIAEIDVARNKANAELEELQKTLPKQESTLSAAGVKAAKLRKDYDSLRSGSGFWRKALAVVGMGELAESATKASEAGKKRDKLQAQLEELQSRHSRLKEDLKQLARKEKTKQPKLEQRLQATEAARTKAAQERSDARSELEIPDHVDVDGVLLARHQAAQDKLQRLQHYAKLEQRWFEITGLSSANGRSAVEEVAEQIGSDLLDVVNLVCCTTTGIAGQTLTRDASFDTLIVDEASRVTDSEFLIGAVRARRWILVGDEHQLPPFVDSADEYHLHAMAALHRSDSDRKQLLAEAVSDLAVLWQEDEEQHQFREKSVLKEAERLRDERTWAKEYQAGFSAALRHLKKEYENPERALLQTMRDYLVRSLFERCVLACQPTLRQRLEVQRRMIEPIARIVAEPIYGGNYRTPSMEELAKHDVTPLTNATFQHPIVFLDTSLHRERASDIQSGNGFINPIEVDWVVNACRDYDRALRKKNEKPITVSILSFYRAQAREIGRKLGWPKTPFSKLDFRVIDSIDRIQGQESDLVILSFCRTHRGYPSATFGQWLQDVRRLNVACTRAHRALVLVGHSQTLQRLCSNPKAQNFYKHLFALFPAHPKSMELNKNYQSGR